MNFILLVFFCFDAQKKLMLERDLPPYLYRYRLSHHAIFALGYLRTNAFAINRASGLRNFGLLVLRNMDANQVGKGSRNCPKLLFSSELVLKFGTGRATPLHQRDLC